MQGGKDMQELEETKQHALDLLQGYKPAVKPCYPCGANILQLQASLAKEHIFEMYLNLSCAEGFCSAGECAFSALARCQCML